MKNLWKAAALSLSVTAGAVWVAAPANAGVGFSISIGVPGAVGFDVHSGGYCDGWGCPDGYWDYPVWYGPVYYGGVWYRGPVYWRDYGGARWFWVHGGWHRDEWRGPRPGWWSSSYHYGPALGFGYYHDHGFAIPQHHMDYWHGHGGDDWERNHHVDWHNERGHGDWGDHRDDHRDQRHDDHHDDHHDWHDH